MKCCEQVIVTVRLRPSGRELDMELPAFMPVRELEDRLLETLREMDPLHYGRMARVSFRWNDRALEPESTLAQAGIWDGSVLDAAMREEG